MPRLSSLSTIASQSGIVNRTTFWAQTTSVIGVFNYLNTLRLSRNNNEILYSAGTDGNCGIAKLADNGTTVWSYSIGGVALSASSMVEDSAGNLFLLLGGSSTSYLIKFDTARNKTWERSFTTGGISYTQDLDLDSSGNIYITNTPASNDTTRMHVTKIDTSGSIVWAKSYTVTGSPFPGLFLYLYTRHIRTSSSGFCYLNINAADVNDYGFFLLKISQADGSVQWARFLNNTAMQLAYGMVIDSQENIIMSGNANADQELFVVKYNSLGTLLYQRSYGHTNNITDDSANQGGGFQPPNVTVDLTDNIYVVGGWGSSPAAAAIIKISPDFVTASTYKFSFSSSAIFRLVSALYSNSAVVVAGPGASYDTVVVAKIPYDLTAASGPVSLSEFTVPNIVNTTITSNSMTVTASDSGTTLSVTSLVTLGAANLTTANKNYIGRFSWQR